MIKQLITPILTLLIFIQAQGQVTDVVLNLSSPEGLVINNGKLYISESGTNKVLEFDLNTQAISDFVTSLVVPIGLTQRQNDLLIAENNDFKISRKDITTPPSTAMDYVNFETPQSVEPYGLALSADENTLYISEVGGRVYRADLTSSNPTPELIWENTDGTAIDLALNGNNLYISESENQTGQLGRILRIDVTETNPTATEVITNLFFPIGLEIINSELYFTDWSESGNGNDVIKKIDLNSANPQVITVAENLNFPTYLTYDGIDLYISQNDRVSKIAGNVLDVKDIQNENFITIFPNPSDSYLTIQTIDKIEQFEIYDLTGRIVLKDTHSERINISSLKSGTYLLKINDDTFKFVKK